MLFTVSLSFYNYLDYNAFFIFLLMFTKKTGVSWGPRLYPQHLAQCLALSYAQQMLVPSLSTKRKLTPCLGLAPPNVLSAYLSLSGPFPCSSPQTPSQSPLFPAYSHTQHPPPTAKR